MCMFALAPMLVFHLFSYYYELLFTVWYDLRLLCCTTNAQREPGHQIPSKGWAEVRGGCAGVHTCAAAGGA